MPPMPPVVWVILVLAALLVVVRIWAKRLEQTGKRIEDDERIPRSLEGPAARRSKPEAHSSDDSEPKAR